MVWSAECSESMPPGCLTGDVGAPPHPILVLSSELLLRRYGEALPLRGEVLVLWVAAGVDGEGCA